VIRALQITGAGQAALTSLEMPAIGPDDVLIRSYAAGICGSDIELYRGTRPTGFYRYPVIPGHEWSGEIAALGERVHTLSIGQKVVAEGFLYCGSCPSCRNGMTNLCEAGYDELGFTRPGGLAEYVAVPARQVHALPDDASLEEAALLEPTAVVAHAFLLAPPQPGSQLAIIGDGTIGLLAVQLARLYSPAVLMVLGAHDERLELARCLGATHILNVRKEEPLPSIEAVTGGRGMDLIFEGGSRPAGVDLALQAARRGGTVLLEGIAGASATLQLTSDLFVLKHLHVQGIFGANSAAWSFAVQLFTAGILQLTDLISHRFSLDDYQAAFKTVEQRENKPLKVLLRHNR